MVGGYGRSAGLHLGGENLPPAPLDQKPRINHPLATGPGKTQVSLRTSWTIYWTTTHETVRGEQQRKHPEVWREGSLNDYGMRRIT